MCRNLRILNHLKQREVADAIDVKLATYGNVESSQYKVIGVKRLHRLVGFYELDSDRARDLIAAWERCPISPGGEARSAMWAKRNEYRAKARNHDKLKLALAGLVGAWLMALPDAEVCACDFGSVCPACSALERLGLPTFTPPDRDPILNALRKIELELAPAGAP